MNKSNEIENGDNISPIEEKTDERDFHPITEEILKYYPLESNKKRILLVGHDAQKGGAEILLKNMIQELRKQDVEIAVLVKYNGPLIESYKELAPTFIIDSQEKIEYYARELNKNRFESAILNTVLSGNLIPTLQENEFYTVSLIHELPGMINTLNAEEYANIIANTADVVVFPSTFVANKFEELHKIKRKKVIDPQGLYNLYSDFNKEKSRLLLKYKHDIPENNHIILNVGLGEQRKGFDLFYETSQKLKDNYTFIWVGHISDEMKEKYLEDINNAENIILPGYISNNDELMAYFDACDLFLLPSREDPFPSVVLEAFNAQKPVIGFKDAGGFQDIVIDNKTGFLVDFESTEELTKKIKLICQDEELKNYLGGNAKKLCEQYDFSNYVNILKQICFNKGDSEKMDVDRTSSNFYKIDIRSQKENIADNYQIITSLENDIRFKNEKILNLKRKNNELIRNKENLLGYKKEICSKNKQISDLKKKNKQLAKEKREILSSSSWKLTDPLRKFKFKTKKIFSLKNNVKSVHIISKENTSKNEQLPIINKKGISSLKSIYSEIYGGLYSYRTYIINENLKRVNLFIDNIDGTIYEFDKLFSFLIDYCNKYQSTLRIIYNSADFELFNEFLKVNNLKLPENVSFLYLKHENYLEIGLNEKYVCTSWLNAKCLMNTYSINSVIYYYLGDLDECSSDEYFQISNICYNDDIVILTDDLIKLNKLKKFEYDYDINLTKKFRSGEKILCCDFKELFIEGIEFLKYLFLNNTLDERLWKIYIITDKNISKFYLNSNILVTPIREKIDNCDLFLKLSYSNNQQELSDNYISIYINDSIEKNYNIINIIDDKELESFDRQASTTVMKPKLSLPLDEILNKIKEVN